MNLKLSSVIIGAFLPLSVYAAAPHVGFYQTIDDETNLPKSIVALYEYADGAETSVGGRVVALYGTDGVITETLSNPTRIADNVKDSPKMVGLDIIWDMQWDESDQEYSGGKIMDPKTGKVYTSVMWQDIPAQLNVRGKIGPFGRTQKWNVLDENELPADLQNLDTGTWQPLIHK